jgi:murein DD-endopeptidase MepM/ murein hydrolase activator NlpD
MIKTMNLRKWKYSIALVLSLAVMFPATPAGARWDELIHPGTYYAGVPVQEEEAVETGSRDVYRVKRGDTLSGIAVKLGLSASRLAAMNNLRDQDRIFEGQILQIPSNTVEHRVAKGETLSEIATQYGVDLNLIASCNNIKDFDTVFVGTKLTIPTRNGESTAVKAAGGLPAGNMPWPVTGWVSSPFGFRDGRMHEGLDIAADRGDPITAVRGGRVTFAGIQDGYGLTVIIDHGEGLSTLYSHCSQLLVKAGDRVASGQLIARVGSTGRSTGPHLHLEVRVNGVPYDPMLCLERMYA